MVRESVLCTEKALNSLDEVPDEAAACITLVLVPSQAEIRRLAFRDCFPLLRASLVLALLSTCHTKT